MYYNNNGDTMNVDEFINYIEYEKNYSENTIIAYKSNIELFITFCKDNNITNIKKVDYTVIRNYISYLYDNKYTSRSINRMLSALRSYFKYLRDEDIINSNPFTLISGPKQEKNYQNI